MNFCTKCASYYQKPGTCNCFAPIVTTTPQPWYPSYPWVQPAYPVFPTSPVTITWKTVPCYTAGGSCNTGGVFVSGNVNGNCNKPGL